MQGPDTREKAAGMAAAAGGPAEGAGTALDRSAQPLPLQLRLVRRGEQATAAFSLLLQAVLYARSADLTPRQHLHHSVLLLLRASALAAFTLLSHAAWLRWP